MVASPFHDDPVPRLCPFGDAFDLRFDRDPGAARDYATVIDPAFDDLDDAQLEAQADRDCRGLGLHFAVED